MKYNSGRVKKFDQTGITSDRYEFLGLEQAEPDLGDPIVGVSSVAVNPVPSGEQYVLIAVDGYVGKRFWVKSTGQQGAGLQGGQGIQGALSDYQGTQGIQGSQGAQGIQGLQGLQGIQGPLSDFQGTQGAQGAQGLQASQGAQGTQGAQGVQNAQGMQGRQGSQGTQGIQGLQGPLSDFQGTQGAQGAQGTQGAQGIQGRQGSQGTQGFQGTQGLSVQGSQGTQGLSIQGSQGTQGNQGFQGAQGSQGIQGLQGPLSNNQGTQGLQGNQGNQGAQGRQGLQGPLSNNQGTQGSQGSQGLQGNQGVQGPLSDFQGTQGNQGLQGLSNQGVQGLAGQTQGNQGLQGLQGRSNQGLQGLSGSGGGKGDQGAQGIQGLGSQGSQGSPAASGGGGASSFAVMDFSVSGGLTIGGGARITNPGATNSPSASTQVPSTAFIGAFDGRGVGGGAGARTFITTTRVYLGTVSYLYFYVIKDWTADTTSFSLFLEYSYDGSAWNTFPNGGTISNTDQSISANTWTLRQIEVADAAKYYAGVFIRFRQSTFSSTAGNDVWAFTSILASTGGSGGGGGGSAAADKLNIAVMDFANPNSFTLGDGARISTPNVTYGPGISDEIPSYAPIGMLDGVRVSTSGSRTITTKNRVYLSTIDLLYFYVIKDYYETTSYNAFFQHSTDAIVWSTFPGQGTLDKDDATISSNTWTERIIEVPTEAKDYAGVYLRFNQNTWVSSLGADSWAFSSVMASFSSSSSGGGGGNIQLSAMNFDDENAVTIGTGTRLSTPKPSPGITGYPLPASAVPSYAKIALLDGWVSGPNPAASSSGTRFVQNNNRIYLSTADFLYFYVIKDYYGTTNYNSFLEYSTDAITWTTFPGQGTLSATGDSTLPGNTWSLRKVFIPEGAKNYGGVYLRFNQNTWFNSAGSDGWGFSAIMIGFSSGGGSSGSSGNLPLTVLNFDDENAVTIGTGTRLSTPKPSPGTTGYPFPASAVPSYAKIALLDGWVSGPNPAVSSSGTRFVQNNNRVLLSNLDFLYFYVIKDYYETTSYNAFFQHSTDAIVWSTFPGQGTLDKDDATISSNTWTERKVRIPEEIKNYGGVYLRFNQNTWFNSAGADGWGFSAVTAGINELAGPPSRSSTGNLVSTVLNMEVPSSLILGSNARLSTPKPSPGTTGYPLPSAEVPSYARIGLLDGWVSGPDPAVSSNVGSGNRTITSYNRVILSGCNTLEFYAIKDYYESATYDAFFQYSTDSITWTTFSGGTLSSSTFPSNIWTRVSITVPPIVKNYGGVYLRFNQNTWFNSAGADGWAFTSVVALSGSSFAFSDKTTAYVLQFSDDGSLITTNSNITIPSGLFSAGATITVYNDNTTSPGTSIQIIPASGVTLYLAGTQVASGTRFLSQRGLCTIICVDTNTFVINGAGLS